MSLIDFLFEIYSIAFALFFLLCVVGAIFSKEQLSRRAFVVAIYSFTYAAYLLTQLSRPLSERSFIEFVYIALMSVDIARGLRHVYLQAQAEKASSNDDNRN